MNVNVLRKDNLIMSTFSVPDIKKTIKELNSNNVSLYNVTDVFLVGARDFLKTFNTTSFVPSEESAIEYMIATGGGYNVYSKNYMADVSELLKYNKEAIEDYFNQNKVIILKQFISILFQNLPRLYTYVNLNRFYTSIPIISKDMVTSFHEVLDGDKPISTLALLDVLSVSDIYGKVNNKPTDYSYYSDMGYKRDAEKLEVKLQHYCDCNCNDLTKVIYILECILRMTDSFPSCSTFCIGDIYKYLFGDVGLLNVYNTNNYKLSTNGAIMASDKISLFLSLDINKLQKENNTSYKFLIYILNMMMYFYLKENIHVYDEDRNIKCCETPLPCKM
jgi:hypothetical protein